MYQSEHSFQTNGQGTLVFTRVPSERQNSASWVSKAPAKIIWGEFGRLRSEKAPKNTPKSTEMHIFQNVREVDASVTTVRWKLEASKTALYSKKLTFQCLQLRNSMPKTRSWWDYFGDGRRSPWVVFSLHYHARTHKRVFGGAVNIERSNDAYTRADADEKLNNTSCFLWLFFFNFSLSFNSFGESWAQKQAQDLTLGPFSILVLVELIDFWKLVNTIALVFALHLQSTLCS